MSRVFLTVLDAVGAGELPDAADYGDVGTNTLGHVIAACDPKLPNMAAIGLGRCCRAQQGQGYDLRPLGDCRRPGGKSVSHLPARLPGFLYRSV